MPSTTFDGACIAQRVIIKGIAQDIKSLVDSVRNSETNGVMDQGEMIANLMLTYRHLEDASMRLGKAIQAYEGGVSIYDKPRDRHLSEEVVGA